MANGNNTTLTPAKIIGICIAITVAVNGWTAIQLSDLRREMNAKTDQRYRQSDALRDLKLVNFRFMRNEEKLQRCEDYINEHRKDHGPRRQSAVELADQR
jgi:hypothetical protein